MSKPFSDLTEQEFVKLVTFITEKVVDRKLNEIMGPKGTVLKENVNKPINNVGNSNPPMDNETLIIANLAKRKKFDSYFDDEYNASSNIYNR